MIVRCAVAPGTWSVRGKARVSWFRSKVKRERIFHPTGRYVIRDRVGHNLVAVPQPSLLWSGPAPSGMRGGSMEVV